MNKLYVSDLDGTLFNDDGQITNYTKSHLNDMIKNGLNFTIATARSSKQVYDMLKTKGLTINLPVVVGNGMAIYDFSKKKFSNIQSLDDSILKPMLQYFINNNIPIFLSGITNSGEDICYYTKNINCYMKGYIDKYGDSNSYISVDKIDDYESLNMGHICKIRTIGKFKELSFYREYIKSNFNVKTYLTLETGTNDTYGFEILKQNTNKGTAIKFLKNSFSFDSVTCFGNDENDIDMFLQCETSCAVQNSLEQLKKISTIVIKSNNEDAVCDYIIGDFKK